MPEKKTTFNALLLSLGLGLTNALSYPPTSHINNFLIVGMTDKDYGGDAVNLQNGEYGADQDVLSTDQCNRGTSLTDSSFPSMDSVYDQRWFPNHADWQSCPFDDHPVAFWDVAYTYQGVEKKCAPWAGVDWTGNIAVTSSDGQISVSNTDIYGDLDGYGYDDKAILAASSKPVQSISNAQYFPRGHNPGYDNTIGKLPESENGKDGVGFVPSADLSQLKQEIDAWSEAIMSYTAEGIIDYDILERNHKDGSGPFILELLPKGASASSDADKSYTDANGDGVIIIDVMVGDNDWYLNNADVIIVGDDSVTAIVRVRNGSNMQIANTSIQRCEGSPAVLFAVGVEEAHQSGDAVMAGSNAVLNNVVFWELKQGSSDTGSNNINCQNCQGCSQFIADMVLHTSTSRFNKCDFGVAVPAPEEESALEDTKFPGITAWDGTCTDEMGLAVDCITYTDNPNCADFGYQFGWKDEGCYPSGGPIPFKQGEQTFGLETGTGDYWAYVPEGTVTITCHGEDDNQWKQVGINSNVDTIAIIKGADGGTVYSLAADTAYLLDVSGLAVQKLRAISHIEFCFRPQDEKPPAVPSAPEPVVYDPCFESTPVKDQACNFQGECPYPVTCCDGSMPNAVATCTADGLVALTAPCMAIDSADSDNDGTPNCSDGCPSDPNKTEPGTCGCGVSDMDSDNDGTPNCNDLCPMDPEKIAPGACGCGVSDKDTDGDGTPDCSDQCPNDMVKTEPGLCGCGVPDTDTDGDGVPDCNDACINDPDRHDPGICGCGVPDVDTDGDGVMDCNDGCINDPLKTEPGICGCGVPDVDTDGDGVMDCNDGCPDDPLKVEPGTCGCGVADVDTDGDGLLDCNDGCPGDAMKTEQGTCGCYVSDVDTDGDGTSDCNDNCPNDPLKTEPGTCGCGVPDVDTDGDGVMDCNDNCQDDPLKTEPGTCGCGVADIDSDSDGTLDCNDNCQDDPLKTDPGTCGCGVAETDTDGDGTPDCSDNCPDDMEKTEPGTCGCGVSEIDTDGDGTPDCVDQCPNDIDKVSPGSCGCDVSDEDTDGDGTPDCNDECPNDPLKIKAGTCGCSVAETDSDGDGTPDCVDGCPDDKMKTEAGTCGCGVEDIDSDGDGVMDCLDGCPYDKDKTEPGLCGCFKDEASCTTPPPTDAPVAPTDAPVTTRSMETDVPSKTAAPTASATEPPVEVNSVSTEAPTQPSKASGSGDPHFKTWFGEKFDYHGECDLVLVNNPSFADGLGLRVHIRTTRVKYYSYIESIAVQIGEDVLEFSNDVENFILNGQKAAPKRKYHETRIGGFVVRRDKKAISIRLDSSDHEHQAKIDLVHRRTGFPTVVVDGGSTEIFKGSLGLLGDWSTGKKLARDGVTEMNDRDATAFALEWQVRDTEPVLFNEARFPQYPQVCVPPEKIMGNRLGKSNAEKAAEEACASWKEDKEDCIFDVIATRDIMTAHEGHHSAVVG